MIAAGTRFGPYEILSAIGAGGMGEVYRARDTRLDRIVAIKILSDHIADRAGLRERFDREARTIAGLNHSHICVLHDIGQQDGIDYLVMEYLEGETLAERLKKGPLPVSQVLQHAIEISDALDKAHRKGITHRDLKPANIMLTKSGTKLLDFGLAKLKASPTASPLSQLPTANDSITAQGTILGTLQYMAPEQLEGKEADARTDIFAFGVVVYEMATGKKCFEGKSQASLIAKILETDPPPLSSLQPMTPPQLDRVVKTCLAKEPDNRWQTASDLCRELKWIAESGSTRGGAAATAQVTRNWLKSALQAGAAGAACIVVGLAVWNLKPAPARPVARTVRFFASPPETWGLKGGGPEQGGQPLAVSPDGQRLAFVATSADGKSVLWVRSLDALAAQALAGTEGASSPFWSPDSRFLGFFAGGKLKKIEVSGGPPITLCDATDNRGGTWSRDGVIVFAPTPSSALQRVSASGGVPTAATVLVEGEIGHVRPSFLPDGRHFFYRMANSFLSETGGFPVYLASLDSRRGKSLLNTNSYVVYSDGHLLYLRERTLMAQPFDTRRLVLTGDAFPIAEQIQTIGTNFLGIFSAAENGVLAYQTGSGAASSQLLWFDRSGKQIGMPGDAAAYTDLELSPDGKRTSVSISDQTRTGRNIWLYDLAQGLRTRFTFGPATELQSIWSPDGSRIIFNSNRKGHFDLYQKSSTGAATEEVLLEDNVDKYPTSWSPDGRLILYTTFGALTEGDVFILPVSGDRKPTPFLKTRFNEDFGQFSPDGRWVTYQSNESGRNEVYVTPFPGPGGKWQISTAGGAVARWRHDGTEIFYLAPDGKLMAAAVNGKGSSFEVGAVKPLFETRTLTGSGGYDVSADGQRFLVNTAPEQAAAAPITVVVNWTAGLKK